MPSYAYLFLRDFWGIFEGFLGEKEKRKLNKRKMAVPEVDYVGRYFGIEPIYSVYKLISKICQTKVTSTGFSQFRCIG